MGGSMIGKPLVCVSRCAMVIAVLPRWPNSGMSSATGVASEKSPRSTRWSVATTASCLPIDMVTNGCAGATGVPAARSAKPNRRWNATAPPRATTSSQPS